MIQVINAQPGMKVNLFAETLDGYGERSDGYGSAPIVESIYNPLFQSAVGTPAPMTKLETGLWYFSLTMPSGLAALGTYFCSIYYLNENGFKNYQNYLIQCSSPFGVAQAIPG